RCVDGWRDLGSVTVRCTTLMLERLPHPVCARVLTSLCGSLQAIDLVKPAEEWVPTGTILVHQLSASRSQQLTCRRCADPKPLIEPRHVRAQDTSSRTRRRARVSNPGRDEWPRRVR